MGYADATLIIFLVIAFLVGVNAFFVAAEYATVGVGRTRARSMALDGVAGSSSLADLTMNPAQLDQAITACQIGISVSSLALGAYSQVVLAPVLAQSLAVWGAVAADTMAVIAVLAATSSFQIVFGEQLPKSIVVRDPALWALRTAPLLWFISWILTPVIRLFAGLAAMVLRLGGLSSSLGTRPHSSAEISWIVTNSARVGVLRPDQGERLLNAAQFAVRTARDVMVPRVQVQALPITASLSEVRDFITATGHSRIPVFQDNLDTVLGALHAKKMLLRTCSPGPEPSLKSLLRPLPMVPWSMRVLPLLEKMKLERAVMAVVLDEHGGTAGIVSLEDLIEEIVGEVEDEFDTAAPYSGRMGDGSLRLRGEETLDWVNHRYGLELESDEAHTVGGLIMEALSRVAIRGDVIHRAGQRLEVESVSGRRIETVTVVPVEKDGAGEDDPRQGADRESS